MKKKINNKEGKNFIHIRLENREAIMGKQDLLSSEMSLLRIFQNIENYKRIRSEELKKKRLVLRKLGEVKNNFSKLQTILPTLKIPKILQNETFPKEKGKEKIVLENSRKKGNIEQQLLEIQEKLKDLQHSGISQDLK